MDGSVNHVDKRSGKRVLIDTLCDFFDDFQGMVLKFCSDYSRIHFSAVNISTNGGYYVSDHKGKKAGR